MKRAVFRIVHVNGFDLQLWLHTTESPDTEFWDASCAEVGRYRDAHAGDFSKMRGLVLSDGASPNATQRHQLFKQAQTSPVRSVVITEVLTNPLKRGVAVAISWLNPSFQAYQPKDWLKALSYINLGTAWPQIQKHFEEMQRELPLNKTLALLTSAARHSATAQ